MGLLDELLGGLARGGKDPNLIKIGQRLRIP